MGPGSLPYARPHPTVSVARFVCAESAISKVERSATDLLRMRRAAIIGGGGAPAI